MIESESSEEHDPLLSSQAPESPNDALSATSVACVQRSGYTVQEALNIIGFGPWHVALLFYSGLVWASDAMEIMLISFIGPAVRCEWGLSSDQESWLTSAVFFGMLCGAIFWGPIADVLGRRMAFVACAAVTTTFGVLSALAPSYPLLIFARAGVGFGLSASPTQYTLFMEWLPERSRGRWLVLFNIWWTAGTAVEVLLAWTTLNTYGWRLLVGLSAVPFGCSLLLFPMVPDSPQLLMAQGAAHRAQHLLHTAARINCRKLPEGPLHACDGTEPEGVLGTCQPDSNGELQAAGKVSLCRICGEGARQLWRDMAHLMQRNVLPTVFALIVVWWAAAFTYYGLVLLSTELSAVRQLHGAVASNSDGLCSGAGGQLHMPPGTFQDIMIAASAEVPSLVFCLLVVGAPSTRHRAIAASFGLTALALSVLAITPSLDGTPLQLCLFSCRFFAMAAFTILYILTPEILPTRIRASLMGVCNAVSRLGGIVAPFAAVTLVDQGLVREAALAFLGACVIAAFTITFVGMHTKGQEIRLTN